MATDFRTPSDAELRVLDVLWRLGAQTVRGLADELYGAPTPVQYRTVQVQLDRLAKKGLVGRLRDETPQRFRPVVDRARFIADQLQSMADRVCDGSLAPLLLNLAGKARLSDEQRGELRKLLGGEADDE